MSKIKKQTRKLFKARARALKAERKLGTDGTVTEVTPSHPGARRSPYFPQRSHVNLDVAEQNAALRTASGGLKVDTNPAKHTDHHDNDGVTE